MVNILDKAIAAVSPIAGYRRATARAALSILNNGTGYGNYGASHTSRAMRSWHVGGGSSKEDIEDNLDTLRKRSRDAYMGIPLAAGALKTLRTNVVGSGLVPTPQVDADYLHLTEEQADQLQAQITREFNLWADSTACDASGMDNFWRMQTLAFTSFLMNGDAFAAVQYRERPNWPYALQLRLIEADQVCSPGRSDRLAPCKVGGEDVFQIVQGVETNEAGEIIAYWVANRHPLEYDNPVPLAWNRVEAHDPATGAPNILCITQRERAGQRRGVPLLAPVLESLKQLGRYTDAEITAAVISAMFTVFVKSQNPSDGRPFGEMIPAEELIDSADQSSIELGPGAIIDLNPGEEVQFADPKHPNTGYDDFTNATIRLIGAGLEIPPEVMMKQFTTSYSAARGALNEFWRTCSMQRDWFTDDFCQPVYEEWFAEAVARGRIHAPGFFTDPARRKAYTACAWNGPARTNLNPVQEVDAAIKRVDAGFSTAQEETAQMTGGDYNRNIKLRVTEAKRKREVDEIGKAQTAGE
jgi:lambda family phage portal protein